MSDPSWHLNGKLSQWRPRATFSLIVWGQDKSVINFSENLAISSPELGVQPSHSAILMVYSRVWKMEAWEEAHRLTWVWDLEPPQARWSKGVQNSQTHGPVLLVRIRWGSLSDLRQHEHSDKVMQTPRSLLRNNNYCFSHWFYRRVLYVIFYMYYVYCVCFTQQLKFLIALIFYTLNFKNKHLSSFVPTKVLK